MLADIKTAKADPVKRYLEIEKLHKVGKPPPWLLTDKPWDDPSNTGKEVPVTVAIPPLDSLTHDAAYFQAVKDNPLHGGLLDPVRDYYRGCAMAHDFDPGPVSEPFASLVQDYPGSDVYPSGSFRSSGVRCFTAAGSTACPAAGDRTGPGGVRVGRAPHPCG